jgi:hypothetical protein
MKYALVLLILLCCVGTSSSQELLQGTWNTGQENTNIEILQENNDWIGKIVSSDNENVVVGKVILKELEKNGNAWSGKLFVLRRQKWVDVDLTPDKTNMDVQVSVGIKSRNLQWIKVNQE